MQDLEPSGVWPGFRARHARWMAVMRAEGAAVPSALRIALVVTYKRFGNNRERRLRPFPPQAVLGPAPNMGGRRKCLKARQLRHLGYSTSGTNRKQ